MGEHTVSSFDQELEDIDRLIRDMGDLAGSMVEASIRALLAPDNALAQRVIHSASSARRSGVQSSPTRRDRTPSARWQRAATIAAPSAWRGAGAPVSWSTRSTGAS